MLTALSRRVFRLAGWKMDPNVPPEAYDRSVMIAAPHTSQWDFFYTLAAFDLMDIPMRFAIKQEFNLPLLGSSLQQAGALWIDRSGSAQEKQRISYVDMMAGLFAEHDKLVMLIAAEGSRSLRANWRLGFYHVAKQAGVPITLGYLDYAKRIAGVGPAIYPSDDMDADLRAIMDFYRPITGKHPEKFQLDERWEE
jgi:1-acyl-sn-glycerol-3-phosphate acyltransferase